MAGHATAVRVRGIGGHNIGLHRREFKDRLVATGAFDNEMAARRVPDRSAFGDVDPGMSVEYGSYLATIGGCTS